MPDGMCRAPDAAPFGASEPAGIAIVAPSGAVPATLTQRADFLRAASARRQGTPGFLLQARDRQDGSSGVRVGFTCSRKVGNAVVRNRARRRLREVARMILPDLARPGWDYVLVGRPGVTTDRHFEALLADLRLALSQIHAPGARTGARAPRKGRSGDTARRSPDAPA